MARDMIIRNPVVELATTDELTRFAGYGEEKLSTVVVSGTLLCDAFLRKNSPLESRPIPGMYMHGNQLIDQVCYKTIDFANYYYLTVFTFRSIGGSFVSSY